MSLIKNSKENFLSWVSTVEGYDFPSPKKVVQVLYLTTDYEYAIGFASWNCLNYTTDELVNVTGTAKDLKPYVDSMIWYTVYGKQIDNVLGWLEVSIESAYFILET